MDVLGQGVLWAIPCGREWGGSGRADAPARSTRECLTGAQKGPPGLADWLVGPVGLVQSVGHAALRADSPGWRARRPRACAQRPREMVQAGVPVVARGG